MSFFISYLLPFLYFVLLALLLKQNKYLTGNGFSPLAIIVFFTAKCTAGILNDYIGMHYGWDVKPYFEDGLALYKTLLHDPAGFLDMLKQMFTIDDFSLFNSHSDFIRTVSEGIKFIHFTANLFSGGNVYTNTILFNGLTTLAFLRCWIFLKNYTSGWVTGAWLFLMPSAFFYTSNILKEGIACAIIALLLPLGYQLYQSFRFRPLLVWLILFCLLFFYKFILAITFAYAVFTWWLLSKYPKFKATILLTITIAGIGVFFLARYLHPALDFPAYVAHRQQEFLALKANSMFPVQILEPSFTGFIKVLPSAIANVLFKPLPGEGGQLLYLLFAIEIYVFWAFIIYLAYKNRFKIKAKLVLPLFWSMLLFAISNLLIIGYIIPNIGAMVRYRSIFLPWPGIFFWHLFNGNARLPTLTGLLSQSKSK